MGFLGLKWLLLQDGLLQDRDKVMEPTPLHIEFLLAEAKYFGWRTRDPLKIATRLCEEYFYSLGGGFNPPKGGSKRPLSASSNDFIKVAFGWFWGKTGDYIDAGVQAGTLNMFMDEVWETVAKQNNWIGTK
jgi:hypothetical protein